VNLRRLHRRLAVLMALAGLLAFAGGAGLEPLSAILAAAALVLALLWQPGREISSRMERVWLPLAVLLVARALLHVFVIRDDVVVPVVDLLLLLMAAEALRSLDAPNDFRLYSLSFALLLAATAYRPGILFLAAFVAYVGLATLGLTVGHLRRAAERHGVREIPLGRPLVWATTGLSGVILLVAAVVFVVFPRVSRGWAGRGETLATSIAGFSEQVSIGEHGSTIYGNPQIVLRVEFPGGLPQDYVGLHWRGRSYDRFDGVRWTRSRSLPPSGGPTRWYRERWTAPRLEQRIYAAPLDVRVLFTLHPVLDVEAENGIQPLFDNAGDFLYWGSGAPAYTAWSPSAAPPAEDLRVVEGGYVPPARYFLQLPELDPRIRALADSLTAGLPTRYDRVVAVQSHLRSFRYTRDLPATARETSLEHFLFERRAGHCEYFSTAMVVLLRAAGIEARNVNGFLGGEWNEFGGYLAVTQNQAHSWVEVWFPEYGWVTFDPTPAGAGGGAGAEAWFWPGRIFFDGLQHRWNKWVLDYNLESQGGLFQRWSGLLHSPRVEEVVARASGAGARTLWGPIALAALVLTGVWWVRSDRRRFPRETRIYLQLREACEHGGVRVSAGLTPLALVSRVREVRGGAAGATAQVVDLYLRARYGRQSLGEAELRAMARALKEARRSLRVKA
jgi:protein-glutamine gamma-glutamyltransferase